MKNIFRIFARDAKRILTTPAALIVVLALIVLPSLYTWINVISFWDPYNNTSNLRVCVVNEDIGGYNNLTGYQDVGALIESSLRENDQLDWAFVSRNGAMSQLQNGTAYAVFVIPQDFTANLLSMFTGNYTQPTLEYYVNEKLGPVSPKITDTGSTTLEETINSTFISTVSEIATNKMRSFLIAVEDEVKITGSNAVSDITSAQQSIADAVNALNNLCMVAEGTQAKVAEAQLALTDAHSALDDLSQKFAELATGAGNVQTDLMEFNAVSLPAMNNSVILLGQISANTSMTLGQVAGDLAQSKGMVDGAITQAQVVVGQNKITLEKLTALYEKMSDLDPSKEAVGSALTLLTEKNNDLEATLVDLKILSDEIVSTSAQINDAGKKVNTMVQTAVAGAVELNTVLDTSTIPALSAMLISINNSATKLSLLATQQHSLLDQTEKVLSQLDSTLIGLQTSFGGTASSLDTFNSDLSKTLVFFRQVAAANNLETLLDSGYLNPDAIADFMLSPTTVDTQQLYTLNAYGSAMAPLFMNLTFWIGAFMLLVILKQEVDDEKLVAPRPWERFMGRWILLALPAALQAVVCCAGVLAIGVQTVSAPALFLAAVVSSVVYLTIMYTLAVLLQHVGKGLCIILVFVQIPAGTGLYPIEMTSSFFRALYPFFPFTYGINAMREAICGFYGDQYVQMLGTLGIFFVIALVAGLTLRPLTVNVNRLFAKELDESGIMVCEEMHIPERRIRLGSALKAVSEKEEFSAYIQKKAKSILAWYPIIKTALIVLLVVGIVSVTVILNSLTDLPKEAVLSAWLIVLVVVMVLDIVAESAKDSIQHKLLLSEMSEQEIRDILVEQARKAGRGVLHKEDPTSEEVPHA